MDKTKELIQIVEQKYNKMIETKYESMVGVLGITDDGKNIAIPYCIFIDGVPRVRVIDNNKPHTFTGWYSIDEFKNVVHTHGFEFREYKNEGETK